MKCAREVDCLSARLTSDIKEQPLTPALSPCEGERENLSLILEHASDLDFRAVCCRTLKQLP
jgi:hypothetical protein